MRRKGDFSGDIARKENYYKAFDHASKNKHGKKAIIKFEADLEKNLSDLLYSFENGTFVTSPYRFMTVHEPKNVLSGCSLSRIMSSTGRCSMRWRIILRDPSPRIPTEG